MNAEVKDPYDVVLSDLLAQRERIDAAIAAIQAIKGGALPAAATPAGNGAIAAKIEADSFFGLTVLEAAVKYLRMMKRPQKGAAIAQALKEGGYNFTSDNPLPTVASILNRNDAKGGEIVRIGKGTFGLAEWYKARPKRRTEDEEDDSGADGDAAASSAPPTQKAS